MKRSAFVRHVSALLTGSAASQALSLLLVPVIARLYSPADFGVAAIFVTVSQALGMVVSLRYFRACLLTDDDEKARHLLSLSVWLLVVGCVLVQVFVSVAWVAGIGPESTLGYWILMVPAAMFLFGISQIQSAVHSRQHTFRNLAGAEVVSNLVMSLSRIAFGLGSSSIAGLVWGYLLARAGKIAILARGGVSMVSLLTNRVPLNVARKLAVEYKDFPLLNMPAGLVNFLAGKIPLLVMGMIYAPEAVGLYAMADRLIRMPVVTAGIAVREVFLRKQAMTSNAGADMARPLGMLTLGMLLLGLVPFGLLGTYGDVLLGFLLGEQWLEAGSYVQILVPWYYAVWVSAGVQPTLMTLRRQGLWLRLQVFILVVRISVFVVGYLFAMPVRETLIWFSGVNVVSALAVLGMVFIILRKTRPQAD